MDALENDKHWWVALVMLISDFSFRFLGKKIESDCSKSKFLYLVRKFLTFGQTLFGKVKNASSLFSPKYFLFFSFRTLENYCLL